MMTKSNLVASLILIISMTFACQTLRPMGPTGDYLARTSTPEGVRDFTMNLKADGTGYLESVDGKSEFSDAEIEGNNFKFYTTANTQMGVIDLTFIGSVDGDNISGTIGTFMGDFPFEGQRK